MSGVPEIGRRYPLRVPASLGVDAAARAVLNYKFLPKSVNCSPYVAVQEVDTKDDGDACSVRVSMANTDESGAVQGDDSSTVVMRGISRINGPKDQDLDRLSSSSSSSTSAGGCESVLEFDGDAFILHPVGLSITDIQPEPRSAAIVTKRSGRKRTMDWLKGKGKSKKQAGPQK